MSLTDNECIKLRSAIYAFFNNKDDWNNFFKDEQLNVKIDISNYPKRHDLDNIKYPLEKIKILIFEAPHADLLLNQEYDSIKSSINSSNHSNSFKISRERVISADEIREKIANEKPDIVHFCGHGLEDGSFSLGKETVKPKFLKTLFSYHENKVKCVIFNTCNSEQVANIISPHIDYVISMNNSILDDKAIHFAKNFYSGLVQAYSDGIDIFLTGFVQGIIALTKDDYSQELIPILKIRYEQAILNLIKRKDAEGKIDDFIKILRPNLSTNKIFNEFYHDYSYPIKKDDLNQLVEIIRGCDWDLVTRSYTDTLPPKSMIDNSELNKFANIDSIIDILYTNYPFMNDKPSILKLATNIAGKLEEKSQEYQNIKKWVEEVSKRLNINISVAPKLEEISNTNKKTFLFIIISPEDTKFRLEAQYILDENKQYELLPFDFKEILKRQMQLNGDIEADNDKGVRCDSDKEINSVIEGIISIFLSQFKEQILKPIIEIFLPYKYLGRNLDDEWRIKDDFEKKIAIVQEYQIVLHPLERFRGRQSSQNFKESWLNFQQFLENESSTSLIVEDIANIHKIDKNYRELGTSLKKKKCVKLTSPLSPLSQIEQENFWKGVLIGGTPLVFWIHTDKQINLNDTDAYLRKEYLNNNFQNLINEMCNIRQDAYNDEDNKENKLGYNLGFLCDNPNRIPNPKLLKSS